MRVSSSIQVRELEDIWTEHGAHGPSAPATAEALVIESPEELGFDRGYREASASSFAELDEEVEGDWGLMVVSDIPQSMVKDTLKPLFSAMAICRVIPENITKVALMAILDPSMDIHDYSNAKLEYVTLLGDLVGSFSEDKTYFSLLKANGIPYYLYGSNVRSERSWLVLPPYPTDYETLFTEEKMAGFRWRFAAYECWKMLTATRTNRFPDEGIGAWLGDYLQEEIARCSFGQLVPPMELISPPGGWDVRSKLDEIGVFARNSKAFAEANAFVNKLGCVVGAWEDALEEAGMELDEGDGDYKSLEVLAGSLDMEARVSAVLAGFSQEQAEWPAKPRKRAVCTGREETRYYARVVPEKPRNIQYPPPPDAKWKDRRLGEVVDSLGLADPTLDIGVLFPKHVFDAELIRGLGPMKQIEDYDVDAPYYAVLTRTRTLDTESDSRRNARRFSSRLRSLDLLLPMLGLLPEDARQVLVFNIHDDRPQEADTFAYICDEMGWELIFDEREDSCEPLDLAADPTVGWEIVAGKCPFDSRAYKFILPAAKAVKGYEVLAQSNRALVEYAKQAPLNMSELVSALSFDLGDGEAFGLLPTDFPAAYARNNVARTLSMKDTVLSPEVEGALSELVALWRIWDGILSEHGLRLGRAMVPDVRRLQELGRQLGVDPVISAYYAGVPLGDLLLGYQTRH